MSKVQLDMVFEECNVDKSRNELASTSTTAVVPTAP
jgi:hypothetical protein